MKYLSLIYIVLFFACNETKEKSLSEITSEPIVEETVIKIDTLKFSLDKDLVENDLVLIQLLEKKYDKDSISTSIIRLDFYNNHELINQSNIEIIGLAEGSDWYCQKGFTYNENPKYSPFLIISNGYPACGYGHSHYLFYAEKNNFQLIDKYYTVGDGGWFDDVVFKENSATLLSSRNESYWADDSENEEMGDLTYSDSVTYALKNNKWVKTYITPKDSIYSSKKVSFNEYHKSEE